MCQLGSIRLLVHAAARASTTLIAAGLLILIAAMLFPTLPTVTAIALVALGATGPTLARFRRSHLMLSVMFVHLAVYGSVYALCVGATLDAAANGSNHGLSPVAAADVAISIGPIALALALTRDALRRELRTN